MSVAHAMPRRPSHICRVQAERDRVGGAGEGWAVAGRDGPWRGRLGRGGGGSHRAREPIHDVEERGCAAVACVVHIDALDVVAVVLVPQHHEVGLDGLRACVVGTGACAGGASSVGHQSVQ